MAGRKKETADEHFLQVPPDDAFRHTDPWRVMRIQSEFVRGFDGLAGIQQAVTIFGSARTSADDPMYQAAVETARLLGESGFAIITGGGPGIMQAGNQGGRQANVRSIGLNIELPFEQTVNPYCDRAIEFRYFFVRKTMLVKYSQAFVIFPGGYGTLDELMEALTLIQTGKIHNFPIVLFGSSYWEGLVKWLHDTVLARGNISAHDLQLMTITDSPSEVCEIITSAVEGRSEHRRREQQAVQATARVYAEPTGDGAS